MNRYAERLGRLYALMDEEQVAGLLFYGSQFRKDYLRYAAPVPTPSAYGFCLLTRESGHLFLEEPWHEIDPPETVQATHGARSPRGVSHLVGGLIRKRGIGPRIGLVGGDILEVGLMEEIQAVAGAVEFVPATKELAAMRMVKDSEELAAIRGAAHLADEGYAAFVKACWPGRKQFEIVADVEGFLRTIGAEDNFMLIASGGRDVYGMTPPSARTLQRGDNVITELTPQVGGYYIQICRSLTLGPPSPEQQRSFDIFKRAADAAIVLIKPGVKVAEVARAENDVFRAEGFGEYCTEQYTRVRGHGVGLYPDEDPVVWEDVQTVLQEGMVLIAHPNTYLPLSGYMVFGDTLVVTRDGCEILTRTERKLFEAQG